MSLRGKFAGKFLWNNPFPFRFWLPWNIPLKFIVDVRAPPLQFPWWHHPRVRPMADTPAKNWPGKSPCWSGGRAPLGRTTSSMGGLLPSVKILKRKHAGSKYKTRLSCKIILNFKQMFFHINGLYRPASLLGHMLYVSIISYHIIHVMYFSLLSWCISHCLCISWDCADWQQHGWPPVFNDGNDVFFLAVNSGNQRNLSRSNL